MNKEKQRIAIAEACGWEPLPEGHFHPDNPIGQTMPNYLNDLNAMHEAEKTLTHEQRIDHMEWLGMCPDDYGHKVWAYVHATAAQRAEAFLRTIGKWEDDK